MKKIKGKEYKGSKCCSSCFDDYRSIIRYKDKTGIRIYIGKYSYSSNSCCYLIQVSKSKKRWGDIYIYPNNLGIQEFYYGYKFLKDRKIARRWLLSEIRKFGDNISKELDQYFNSTIENNSQPSPVILEKIKKIKELSSKLKINDEN